ncbi:MAG: threonine/serine dehydratase [Blastomonas sp.]
MTEPRDRLNPDRKPSREGVERAAKKISALLPPTPLLPLNIEGTTIWCKAECLQPMGAFKIRGAWHRLSDLDAEEQKRGVIAFSSGNHALGVAWSARRLGIDATIVMPADAPRAKRDATLGYGAKIIEYDRDTEDREAIAARLASETGATIVPSFADPWVIEGQGSAGFELAVQMIAQAGLQPGHVIACCGGGGLSSGLALALPGTKMTIVEPDGWDDMGESLRKGKIVPVANDAPPTICDALKTPLVSALTYDILKEAGADALSVSDAEVRTAMRFAYQRLRLVLEPGGSVALAAVLAGKVEVDDRSVIILSGGNVDPDVYGDAIRG